MSLEFASSPDLGMDDRRAFVAAAAAVSRLDEALARSENVQPLHQAVVIRSEAASIAALEGASSRPESVARLIADPDATLVERGARMAIDMKRALEQVATWEAVGPDGASISNLFLTSDASHARLIRPDMAWSLEEDCDFAAEELARAAETPEPWTAIEAVRRIWTSGRFFGHSRRMALLTAPWVIARGFGLSSPFFGLAQEARKDPDRFRIKETDPDGWSVEIAAALAEAARSGSRRLSDIDGLRATMNALCPAERSSSSIGSAIDLLIAMPIVTARRMSEALDVTPRGVKVIADKLLEAGIIEVEGGVRNRRYVCRRAL